MPLRCALLNDHQGVATTAADWSPSWTASS